MNHLSVSETYDIMSNGEGWYFTTKDRVICRKGGGEVTTKARVIHQVPILFLSLCSRQTGYAWHIVAFDKFKTLFHRLLLKHNVVNLKISM